MTLWAFATPAQAMIQCSSPAQCCLDDVNDAGAVCTANDVTFVLVGLGTQTDGCVNSSDTVSIFLGAIVKNTTAGTRYDIGMWISTDGDPNGDGALTGQCAREMLTPASPTTFVDDGLAPTCLGSDGTLLDLQRTILGPTPPNAVGNNNGYYLTAEGTPNQDACGDLAKGSSTGCDTNGDGIWDDSVMNFTTAVTVPCDDIDNSGGGTSNDGFVNLPTCASWGQQENEIDDNGNGRCDSEAEVENGTPSKCNCKDSNSTIPVARLSCNGPQTTCSPASIQVGQSTTCTVRMQNDSTCTPDTSDPEREQCGTASFIRFRTDFDESIGTVSNISVSGGGSGAVVTESGNQLILWTPESGEGTDGIMGPGDVSTLTYTFTLTSAGTTTSFSSQGWWANNALFTSEVAQSALTCSALITVPVSLASFRADRDGGSTAFEWTTATEVGTVGFNLLAKTAKGWEKVNREPIPSKVVDSTQPQSYRYDAPRIAATQFRLDEIDVEGNVVPRGEFTLGKSYGKRLQPQAIDWQPIHADGVKGMKKATVAAAKGGPVGGGADRVSLLVGQTGIQRVTYEALAAAGLDLAGTNANQIALLHRGAAVPVRIVASSAKKTVGLGPGGYVEFWGEALDTLYTGTNVYTLLRDPSSSRSIGTDARTPSGAPAPFYMETTRVERNRQYSFGSPIGDPWYDTRMIAFSAPSSYTLDLPADGYVAGAAPAALTIEVWGSTVWPASPDHHLRVALNGTNVADTTFDGRTAHTVTVQVPAGVLQAGANTLTLTVPGDLGTQFDLQSLESYSLTYPRAFAARGGKLEFTGSGSSFRVTGFGSNAVVAYRLDTGGPVQLTGLQVQGSGGSYSATIPGSAQSARYAVAEAAGASAPGLRAARGQTDITSGTADYLIISHPSFTGGLGSLVSLHQSAGRSVKVVDVEDVYAQFGHGILDPQPIRDYVAHAAANMGTQYVLLVGGDSYDYRNYLGAGSVSFIPTYYAATGNLIFFAPADPLYADVDGDRVPDLAIGRFPVRTLAELDALVAKTLQYAGKDYGRTAVMAADRFDQRAKMSFKFHSDQILEQLGGDWSAQRAYLDDLSLADARSQLLASLNAGTALTSYVGHSGPTAWTFSGLFSSNDATGLANAGRPTVVVQWGCWNAYHVEPLYNTLGHSFLLFGDRGAAAVLGSATLMETASAQRLSEKLAPRLGQSGVSVGSAITAAKQELAGEAPGEMMDAILGWTILGDPALVVEP
ncbi:MAG TPA: C25 family cysteine peptidase [Thermoanaerobaculia bacterium]|nr:C25 family cysteine peptidase [Thermoanaerobaculia bacterium]